MDQPRYRTALAVFEAETLRARIRMEGMKAANRQHKLQKGTQLPYGPEDFARIERDLSEAQEAILADIAGT